MRAADLPEVAAIAALCHPDLPEPPEVFAERLALFPAGCWMAEGGYAIAHPWAGEAPALAARLGTLPEAPDHLFLHDVALRPAARGRGLLPALLARLEALGLPEIRLVAVRGTRALWARHGFVPSGPAKPGYGTGAEAMRRVSSGSAPG
jgi:GNAT superfamily N-acetyltransferase